MISASKVTTATMLCMRRMVKSKIFFALQRIFLKKKVCENKRYLDWKIILRFFTKQFLFLPCKFPSFKNFWILFSGSPSLSRISRGFKLAGPFELMTSSKCYPRERTIRPTFVFFRFSVLWILSVLWLPRLYLAGYLIIQLKDCFSKHKRSPKCL